MEINNSLLEGGTVARVPEHMEHDEKLLKVTSPLARHKCQHLSVAAKQLWHVLQQTTRIEQATDETRLITLNTWLPAGGPTGRSHSIPLAQAEWSS